jgi:hypothetical protein
MRIPFPIEQKGLLVDCSTIEEFSAKFEFAFGKEFENPSRMHERIVKLWWSKSRYRKEAKAHKVESNIVMIPARIKKPAINNHDIPFSDDAHEVEAKNTLREIAEIVKEILAVQRKQLVLFETLAGGRK